MKKAFLLECCTNIRQILHSLNFFFKQPISPTFTFSFLVITSKSSIMQKHLLFLLGLLLLSLVSFAQKNSEDVVYLKNGNIIRGIIIDQIIGEKITIETYGGNVYNYPYAEVERIAKEDYKRAKRPLKIKQKGYVNTTSLGFLFGNGEQPVSSNLQTINGYHFNPHLALGLGMGIVWYDAFGWGNFSRVLPIFLDVRGNVLKDSKISPFYYANAGYGIETTGELIDERNGGLKLGLGTGIKIHTRNNVSWVVSLGINYQQLKASGTDWWSGNTVERTVKYRRLALRTGFSF